MQENAAVDDADDVCDGGEQAAGWWVMAGQWRVRALPRPPEPHILSISLQGDADSSGTSAHKQDGAGPSREGDVLRALGSIIDPDFGMSIVDCGFVKASKATPLLQLLLPVALRIDSAAAHAGGNLHAPPPETSQGRRQLRIHVPPPVAPQDLAISPEGRVSFRLELTTPACPVKVPCGGTGAF